MNDKSRSAIAEVLAEDKKPLVSPAVSEHAMLESVPQLRARIEELELDLAEAQKRWLRAMGSAAELERQLDALNSSQAGFALVPVERSYEMRAAAILHYNTAKQSGKDHDDALDAAWRAALKMAHGPDGLIATDLNPGGGVPDWGVFASYLLDRCEGDTISEEGLQRALHSMVHDPHYGQLFRGEKAGNQTSEPDHTERAAFREHLARCATEVATWPEWKRNCMGQVLLPDQEISEIDKHRIELLPEYGAGYVARAYGEEAEPIAEAAGFTAAEAIKLVVAALSAPTAKKEG